MKFNKLLPWAAVLSTLWLSSVSAQIYNYTTIAGLAGAPGSTNGLGAAALFNYPTSVGIDNHGNLFLADYGNSTIREIVSVAGQWVVGTVAGTAGVAGSTDSISRKW